MVFDQLLKNAAEASEKGYRNILIILGDFYDRGFSDAGDAMMALEFARMAFSNFDKVFAVVGNHELTYYKNNPFWFLVSGISDNDLLREYTKIKQPKGFLDSITVTDKHIDGEVAFIFNHYGTRIKQVEPQCKVNIGLFHQNIASHEIPDVWGEYIDIEKSQLFDDYTYMFLGHIHSNEYYGRYKLASGTIAYYLSSVVRASVSEIDDNYLIRNIPIVYVEDGKFTRVEDKEFRLLKRSECVIEEIVKANKAARDALKKRKEIFNTELTGSSLYEIALTNAKLAGVDMLLEMFLKKNNEVLAEYKMLLAEVETGGILNE